MDISGTSVNGIKTMQLNDEKAGMQGLDKEAINKVIYEASKGTPYFSFQEKRQQRINQRVKNMFEELQKVTAVQREESKQKMDVLCVALEAERDLSHSIVHLDMDAFYAAVEMLDNPNLKDKPMAVGSLSMLATSNYEARKYGVRAAMPGFIAKKLCPQVAIIPCNFGKYKRISKQVMGIIKRYDPDSSAASLDEVYFDLTQYIADLYRKKKHMEQCENDGNSQTSGGVNSQTSDTINSQHSNSSSDVKNWFKSCETCDWSIPDSIRDKMAYEIVQEIRHCIFQTTKLTASAGIAPTTMLAKVCSDQNKPDGQFQIPSVLSEVQSFIHTLPIKKISGIGPVQAQLLNALGVNTCYDLYEKRDLVDLLFSSTSSHFYMRAALGLGSTVVKSDYVRKSIGNEVTFKDTESPEELHKKCEELCHEMVEDLKSHHMVGKVVVLKIKTTNFNSHTRNSTIPFYTSNYDVILKTAKKLLDGEILAVAPAALKLRLMGVRMANLLDENEIEDDKQVKLESFLQPKKLATPGSVSSSTPSKFTCPVCSCEFETSLSDFNRHIDKCLNGLDTAEQSCPSSTGQDESPVICPICGVEQKSNELSEVNAHIDTCLSKGTIKELLATDVMPSASIVKRKSLENGSQKSKKVRTTHRTLDHYFQT